LYGLTEYIIKTNDVNNLNKIKNNFEKLVNIRIDKVDQAPFGIVALNLYDVYKDSKYLLFANSIFAFIKERADRILWNSFISR
jgi:rhamnogalacturonyl hydrolase YesR